MRQRASPEFVGAAERASPCDRLDAGYSPPLWRLSRRCRWPSDSRARVDSRFQLLVIPLTWSNVWICPMPEGHLQVTRETRVVASSTAITCAARTATGRSCAHGRAEDVLSRIRKPSSTISAPGPLTEESDGDDRLAARSARSFASAATSWRRRTTRSASRRCGAVTCRSKAQRCASSFGERVVCRTPSP